MKYIKTRFVGPTNFKGSRISVTDDDGNRKLIPIDHAWSDPHRQAAGIFCESLNWHGTLVEGSSSKGNVYVFGAPWNRFEV
jgi:hypothetical protein